MRKTLQQKLAITFGITFVVALGLLALLVPYPTPFQYLVFRVVLALAAAGVAAMIPGFLEVRIPKLLRAGGALAVFVVVYFYNPATLVVPVPQPDPTSQFTIGLACKKREGVIVQTYSFPHSDIKENSNYKDLTDLIDRLPNQDCVQTGSKIFRTKDEQILSSNGDETATSKSNTGLVVLHPDVIDTIGDRHVAFTQVYSVVKQERGR